jgi:hypothetical protein
MQELLMKDDRELLSVREYGSGLPVWLCRSALDRSQPHAYVIRASVRPHRSVVEIDAADLLLWLSSPAALAALAANGLPTVFVATPCLGARDPGGDRPSPAWLAIGLMRQARSGLRIKTSDVKTRDALTELLRRGWVKVAVDVAGGDSSSVALSDGGAAALAWAEELLLELSEASVLPREAPSSDRGEGDDLRLTEPELHARGRSAGVVGRASDGGLVGSSSYCAGYVVGSNARLGVLGARARSTLEAFARDSTARHWAEAVAAALAFLDGGPPLEGHHEVTLRALLDSSRSRWWLGDLRDLLAVVSFKMRGLR